MRTPLIAGNWKMHKNSETARDFTREFMELPRPDDVKICIAAPFTELFALEEMFVGTHLYTAAQNMHYEDEGAYTGEISGHMLKEIGVDYVILGHSERRMYFNESNEIINKKVRQAYKWDIIPIVCCGESLEQREQGLARHIVRHQVVMAFAGISAADVSRSVIAYEPIWAIGTGKVATPQQAEDMCRLIRLTIAEEYSPEVADCVTILYGGSVKPDNAGQIMAMEDIDGALVGGASLDPQSFMDIVNYRKEV